jgi:hypothetical protein
LLLLVSLLNKKQNQNSKLELGIKLGLMLIWNMNWMRLFIIFAIDFLFVKGCYIFCSESFPLAISIWFGLLNSGFFIKYSGLELTIKKFMHWNIFLKGWNQIIKRVKGMLARRITNKHTKPLENNYSKQQNRMSRLFLFTCWVWSFK